MMDVCFKTRLTRGSPVFHCAPSLCNSPLMALSHIRKKKNIHTERKGTQAQKGNGSPSAGIYLKRSTSKTCWCNVLQCTSLHWGNNKLPSQWIQAPSDQMPSFRRPAPLWSLHQLFLLSRSSSRPRPAQLPWKGHRCAAADLIALYMSRSLRNCHSWIDCGENQASGLACARRRAWRRSQRSWFQSYQPAWPRPGGSDLCTALQESHRAHVCLWVHNLLHVRNVCMYERGRIL